MKQQGGDIPLIRQLENGIWQFCLDHARFMGGKMYSAKFGFTTKRDLLRRIYARGTGMYKIKDEAQIQAELEHSIKEYQNMWHTQRIASERESKIDKLPKWKRTVILLLRQFTNKLIKKWI